MNNSTRLQQRALSRDGGIIFVVAWACCLSRFFAIHSLHKCHFYQPGLASLAVEIMLRPKKDLLTLCWKLWIIVNVSYTY